ncbi:MAG: hypothetical protein KJ674_04880 [Nanoarchaeota archaeon]|nr:hypothetical protein [Nanoarchaeota archaeon]
MDTIAHLLWTYLIFIKDKYWKYALVFAVFPDVPLLSYIVYNFFTTGVFSLFVNCPPFIYFLEQVTHSLIFSLIVVLILFLFFRKKVLFLLAWPIHIVVDIFTHARGEYATSFLFPFSEYTFNGLDWKNTYFLIINYVLFLIVYFIVVENVRRNKNIKK